MDSVSYFPQFRWPFTDINRYFFPPTEQDLKRDDENEDQGEESETVHGGKSVDNGVLEATLVAKATVEDLPEVPTTEPSTENEPVPKKRKSSHD